LFLGKSQVFVGRVETDKNADGSVSWFQAFDHLREVGLPGGFDGQKALKRIEDSWKK
jgi:hypothetical protein